MDYEDIKDIALVVIVLGCISVFMYSIYIRLGVF